mgnify:CR=1 FL=1
MSDTPLGESTILKEENSTLNSARTPKSAVRENIKSLAAGGVGGVCAVLTGHPFDLIKVRCQNGMASSTMQAIRSIISDARLKPTGTTAFNTMKGFYKGVIPPLLGVTPIFAVSFWGYDMGKKLVSSASSSSSSQLSVGQMAAAGFISAIPTTAVTAPTERIKVVLQTWSEGSIISSAKKIIDTGGVRSLLKGSLAKLARAGPGSALSFE